MAEIGSTLREARMRARIDITEVELRTKIRAKYLRAIENEEWDLLPGPIYAKSFLRTYGDYLGLDSRQLVDEFRRRYERPSEHDLRPLSALSRERERARRGPLVPTWAIVGLVLVIVVALLFLIGKGNGTNPTPATRAVQPTRTPAVTKPAPHHHHAARPHTASSGRVDLALVATGQVYVCLVDGTGRRLINQAVFTAGSKIPVQRGSKLLLTLGNNAVTVTANGHAVPIAASAKAIRLLLTPGAVKPIPLSERPTCP